MKYFPPFWISVLVKLGQGSHVIKVKSSFSKKVRLQNVFSPDLNA